MTHASNERDLNLIGAFALALADRMSAAIDHRTGLGGTSAAALLLVHHGHVSRIDNLRAPLALTQAGVVRLVDRLVAAGLVRRVAAADGDGRAVALALTRAGTTRARALMQARERAIAELLAGLAPAQVASLGAVSDQVLAAIASEDPARGRLCRYCDEGACDLSRCPVELAAIDQRGAA
jgi:MarR family transcriptional regulator, negative regulator of the multidrug operon emrRAB